MCRSIFLSTRYHCIAWEKTADILLSTAQDRGVWPQQNPYRSGLSPHPSECSQSLFQDRSVYCTKKQAIPKKRPKRIFQSNTVFDPYEKSSLKFPFDVLYALTLRSQEILRSDMPFHLLILSLTLTEVQRYFIVLISKIELI